MKFRTPSLNTRTYSIVPAKYEERAGRREMTTNFLRVKFEGGHLDTDAAQRMNRWSDDQRKQVEIYLLNHADFGMPSGIHLEADQALPDYIAGQISPEALASRASGETWPCAFAVRLGDTSEVCGRIAVEGQPYCDAHAQLASTIPVPPRKRQQAVAAAD